MQNFVGKNKKEISVMMKNELNYSLEKYQMIFIQRTWFGKNYITYIDLDENFEAIAQYTVSKWRNSDFDNRIVKKLTKS